MKELRFRILQEDDGEPVLVSVTRGFFGETIGEVEKVDGAFKFTPWANDITSNENIRIEKYLNFKNGIEKE